MTKTKLKITLLIIIIITILLSISNLVKAVNDEFVTETHGNFICNVYSDKVIITDLVDKDISDIVIPETIKECNTIYIGDWAFFNRTNLKNVEISNSVVSIGTSAFSQCENLESINIPNSVTSIGKEAFYVCGKLKNIELPNSILEIGESAFDRCISLTNINIPNSITSIEKSTFIGCTGLTNIELPNTIASIKESAFNGCEGLTNINIPNSVTNIGASAFYGCIGLTSINIPNSVTNIGEYAFYNCSAIESIEISNKITSISKSMFGGCSNLTNVAIPNSVTSIEDYAFWGCSSLASINLSETLISIGIESFYGCRSLTSIQLPNTLTTIKNGAFTGCEGIEIIEIPDSVIDIGENAFGCNLLLVLKDSYGEHYAKEKGRRYYYQNLEYCIIDEIANETYTGADIEPSIIVKSGTEFLERDVDYTINYLDNINAGTATIIINGIGDYTGKKETTFEILPATYSISRIDIPKIPNHAYTGESITPNLVLKDGDIILTSGVDYYIGYLNNEDVGTATIRISGTGRVNSTGNVKYTGTITRTFIIEPKDISEVEISEVLNQTYRGESITSNVVIKDGDRILSEDQYSVKYTNNKNVGTATVVITGKGNYSGTRIVEFEILPRDISKVYFSESLERNNPTSRISNKIYSGEEICPNIAIFDPEIYNVELTKEKDYILSYSNNKNVGTAMVTIAGIGNYSGTKIIEFTITKATYDMSKVKFEDLTTTYDGNIHSIVATGLPEKVTVSYLNNGKVSAGTYIVTAKFEGNLEGYNTITDRTAILKIKSRTIANTTITGISNKMYSGKEIKQSFAVKDGTKTLKNGTDYTVSYKNNKNVGTATVVITGKENYTGTVTKTFKINPKGTSLKKVTKGKKQFKATWKAQKTQTTGYQIQYATNSKFTSGKKTIKVKKNKTTSTTVKKLKAKKKYYVRIRTYKTVNGKVYYSDWSKVKNVTTKK